MSRGSGAAGNMTIRVWDPVVRLFHWSLVLGFAIAWFSANSWEELHSWAGYAAGVLILIRVAWGVFGTKYARFSQFVRSPRLVMHYLKAIATGSEIRYVGHNPAGGAMVVVLMLAMAFTTFTGWLLTTDAFWGVAWVQTLHNIVAHGLLLLIGLHVAGVLLASVRHGENLIAAMVVGRKRVAAADDIQ